LEYMRSAIADTIVPFDLRVHDEQVTGEIRAVDLGAVRLVCWTDAFTEGEVARTARLIRRSDPELCKIDVQLRGRSVLEQGDRQAGLAPGEFGFADLSRPCRLVGSFGRGAALLFPRALLPLPATGVERLAGAGFGRGDPGAALVVALVAELVAGRDGTAVADVLVGASGGRVGGALLDLITVTAAGRLDAAPAVPAHTRQRALVMRMYAFVERHLADPRLSPSMIAAAHHMSLRQLYKVFQPDGMSVAGWIRASRLERCRAELRDPALTDVTVGAIGARWGLPDPGSFGRAFRAAYGISPGEYRHHS
jgi:AraC-like DNA-binding protein